MNIENMFVLRSSLLFYKLEMYNDELYWLDVSERIQFMICVHVYKFLYGIAPKAMNLYRAVSEMKGQSRAFNG